METLSANNDTTGRQDLKKDVKATDTAARPLGPTVEDYVSDDAEQPVSRPYGIESPGMSTYLVTKNCAKEQVSCHWRAERLEEI